MSSPVCSSPHFSVPRSGVYADSVGALVFSLFLRALCVLSSVISVLSSLFLSSRHSPLATRHFPPFHSQCGTQELSYSPNLRHKAHLTPLFPLDASHSPVSPLFPLDTRNRGVHPPSNRSISERPASERRPLHKKEKVKEKRGNQAEAAAAAGSGKTEWSLSSSRKASNRRVKGPVHLASCLRRAATEAKRNGE